MRPPEGLIQPVGTSLCREMKSKAAALLAWCGKVPMAREDGPSFLKVSGVVVQEDTAVLEV